jgi:hypothetical protein
MSIFLANTANITNTSVDIFTPNTGIVISDVLQVGNNILSSNLLTVGSVSVTPTALNTPKLIVSGSFAGIIPGGVISYQEFTANGVWYNPYSNASANAYMTNNEQVLIMAWGAGGSGSVGGGDDGCGGGGACVVGILPISQFTTTCAVTVGLGNTTLGGNGSDTTFVINSNRTLTAYAGAGSGGVDNGGGGGGVFSAGSGTTGGRPSGGSSENPSTFGGGGGSTGANGGDSIFGGGGGGGPGDTGGSSVFGGGAGGDSGAGTSSLAGNGGTSGASPGTPAGGGGTGGTRYIGARGEVRVWVIGPAY